MSKISTWKELLASDLPQRCDDVGYDTLYKEFAIIEKPTDSSLRLNYGLIIVSVNHHVQDPLSENTEAMLVVMEAQLDLLHGNKPYVPVTHVVPHYRTADNLGLTGNHADPDVYSVLVSTDKLGEIMFSDTPEPLKQWEVDILSDS